MASSVVMAGTLSGIWKADDIVFVVMFLWGTALEASVTSFMIAMISKDIFGASLDT
jgi:hypothetical protein